VTETLSPALPPDVEAMAHAVAARACEREVMLATAESCTGGLLAAMLTDIEGCSHAFERGFVVYTDEAKHQLLGVPEGVLSGPGAVSAEAARAMAVGALANSRAHIAVSITGFAGKGAPGDEPGLVFFGLASHDEPARTVEKHFGDLGRGGVRLECLRTALKLMQDALG
jgi:nicotinamide-nucleotide amidase